MCTLLSEKFFKSCLIYGIYFSQEMETVIHSDDAFATVAYLRLKRLIVEEKQAREIISNPVIVIPSWKMDIESLMTSVKQLVRYYDFFF